MEHLILNEGSDSAALAKVALKALREARRSKTSNSGSIFVSDGKTDDNGIALGTGTIVNGVNGGIQPWVGDTTPPGKPLGITAESHNGAIWVSWDGTLEGGIPADFDHVQFTAVDGSKTVDLGQLRAAGKVTAAELTAGDTVTITAIAYDDAHDAQGNSTPNASVPSDPVTVVVQSAVDAAVVKKAQDDAQAALNQAGQAKSTADGKNKIFSSASEPSHTGIVPGDMWFQLDANNNVSGIKVWNGSAFTDMVLLGNRLLVASSVGTTQIADNAITTGKIGANAVTALQIAAQSITGDKLDVGSVASAIITSGLFQSSTAANTGIKIDATALQMWDSAHNRTVYLDGEGKNNVLTGSFQTSATGNRVKIDSQATSTLVGDSTSLSGQSISFQDNDLAGSPKIYGTFTSSDLGDAPRITLLSGWKTDHDPAATLYLQSWPRTKGATGSGITSRALITANTDYTEPDETIKSYATLDLQGIGGSGAYANLEAHAYNGNKAQTWVTATRNDGVTSVGIGADAFKRSIYLGGKLRGITNQATFQTNNWKAYWGTTAAGATLNPVTLALSPAKYGVYHAVANADCPWGGIFAHVLSTGNASKYRVMGYNASRAAYKGDIWIDTIAWLT